MKKLIVIILAAAAVAGLVFAYLAGRGEVAAEVQADQPLKVTSRVAVVNGENVVALDRATRTAGGIVLAPLPTLTHRAELPAYGSVIAPDKLMAMRLTLVKARAGLAKANAARTVAKQEFDRVHGLFEANQNVSQQAEQAAEGFWRMAAADREAARAELTTALAAAELRWGGVIARWLTQNPREIDRLGRQDDLLVQVTRPPAPGAKAAPLQASVERPDGQLLSATLVSPAPRTDRKLQGPSYFYLVGSDDAGLLPGMNVLVRLPVGEPAPSVLVPDSAVVWLQGKPWIYVEVKADHFSRREVSTDQPVKGGWIQPADFSHGEPIVSEGAQLLLSEEFRAQITVGD